MGDKWVNYFSQTTPEIVSSQALEKSSKSEVNALQGGIKIFILLSYTLTVENTGLESFPKDLVNEAVGKG